MHIVTSIADDKEFGAHFLADVMAWIGDYFEPDDIYSEDELMAFMKDKYDPEDVFEWDDLAVWAKQNGFVHSE